MSDFDSKKVIIVLSAGRSGTSLLMQILNAFGMSVSENLLEGRLENPDGFFEDVEIVELQKKILQGLGTSPAYPMPDRWLDSNVVKRFRPKIQKVFASRLKAAQTIWGFKDPRTCSLLPMWAQIFNLEKVTPIYLLAIREPGSMINSLMRTSNLSAEIAEMIWFVRICDALEHTASDCYIIHYEDWFSRSEDFAAEIIEYTGLNQEFDNNSLSNTLCEIIKPNLNRSVHNAYQIKNQYVSQLYDILKECRGSNFDHERLMQVVKNCRMSINNCKGWYMQAQQNMQKQDKLLFKVKNRVKTLEDSNTEHNNEIQILQNLVNQKEKQLDDADLSHKRDYEDLSRKLKEIEVAHHHSNEEHKKQLGIIQEEKMSYFHDSKKLQEELQRKDKELLDAESRHKLEYQDLQKQLDQQEKLLKRVESTHINQVAEFKNKIEAYETDLENLTLLNNTYVQQGKELFDKVEDLKAKLHKPSASGKKNTQNVSELREKIKLLQKTNEALRNRRDNMEKREIVLRDQIKSLKQQLKESQASTLLGKFFKR